MGSGVVLVHSLPLRMQVCPLSHVHQLLADLVLECERLFLFDFLRSLAVEQIKMDAQLKDVGQDHCFLSSTPVVSGDLSEKKRGRDSRLPISGMTL